MEPIILPLHIIVLIFLAWTIFQADRHAFAWIQGKRNTLSAADLHTLHTRTWIGLALMIVTGLALFWPLRNFLLSQPQFYIKMGFVFALIINGFVIGGFQKVATQKPFRALSRREQMPLIISGAVSTVSWAGATIMAFFLLPG